MGSEWQELPLEDCMDAIIDYRGKTPKKTDSGVPLITAKIIKDGAIQQVSEYIAEEDYDSWMRRGIPCSGDIVMTTEAPLGEVAQLDDRKVALAQRVITLRGKTDLLDNTYLKYLLISEYVQSQLDGRSSGTTVSGIKQSELRKVLLKFPAFEVQKQIANILVSLDDKIALNRQINTTLESMAQALFKSWFVDFDPVIDNALAAGNEIPDALQKRAAARAARREALRQQTNKSTNKTTGATDAVSVDQALPETGLSDQRLPPEIQQLFPDRFVFIEEMGWVPEGWEVTKVAELMDLSYGKSLPATKRVDGSVPVYGSGGVSGYHNEHLVNGPGIIVGRKGTVGSLYWVEDDFFPIDTVFFVENKTELPLYWLYQILGTLNIAGMGADSAVPGVNRNTVYACSVVVPTENVTKSYKGFIDALNSKKESLRLQDLDLANLRDSLLPKLLSGQITIPDAEEQLVEVL